MTHIQMVLLGLVTVLVTSCAFRPNDVLSNKQMIDLLVDLHAAEGTIQVAGLAYGHSEEVDGYYATILYEHGVTQAQFDSSLTWYTAHPAYFQSVYPKVLALLQERMELEMKRIGSAEFRQRTTFEQLVAGLAPNLTQPDLSRPIDSIADQHVFQIPQDTVSVPFRPIKW